MRDEETKKIISRDIHILERNVRRIIKIAGQFIDVLELSGSEQHLQISNHDIIASIQAITDTAREYAAKKAITVGFSSNRRNCWCAVDVDKFEKIILNLLSNAVKFGEEGGNIKVIIKASSADISIVISGNSRKIESDKNEMFKIFTQGDKLFTRSGEGLGAGLYLAENYAGMHNGKVEFSCINGVNVFKVTVPLIKIEHLNRYQFEEEICRYKTHVEFSNIIY